MLVELLLLLLLAFAPDPSDGVCFICDDLLPPLVELDVEFVVLLFDDDDVEWLFELLELRVADVDELPDVFELFKLVVEDEEV